MPLNSAEILAAVDLGFVHVDPFSADRAKGASYDVSLGENYFRMQRSNRGRVRNMYSPKSAKMLWGEYMQAKPLREELNRDLTEEEIQDLKDYISLDEKIIWLMPHELILSHTHEFLGGPLTLVGEIRGRSTVGRQAISVAADCNWGDPGYYGRWTLYIKNESCHTVPLVVERRIAQIILQECGSNGRPYSTEAEGGKYQNGQCREQIQKTWTPDKLLPRMHLDREVRAAHKIAA